MGPLDAVLAAEIQSAGPISFSRFMEVALYDETHGFYARGGAGRRRDFLTSPEVGPLFGALVARALDRWWADLGRPAELMFVELGAGPGTLARSVLRTDPACSGALRYVAVETSAAQRAQHPAEVESVAQMPADIECGVVFANELLDNLPFDVFDHDPGEGWREVRVGLGPGGDCEEVLAPVSPDRRPPPPTKSGRRPDMWRARAMVEQALTRLREGRVVMIDYVVESYPTEPDRPWLRTYRRHDAGGPPLHEPGSQDITADVDLSQLRSVAPLERITTQAEWLSSLGIEDLVAQGRRHWDEAAARPDLAAIEARSRVGEAEALCDLAGLGAFSVMEWHVRAASNAGGPVL